MEHRFLCLISENNRSQYSDLEQATADSLGISTDFKYPILMNALAEHHLKHQNIFYNHVQSSTVNEMKFGMRKWT